MSEIGFLSPHPLRLHPNTNQNNTTQSQVTHPSCVHKISRRVFLPLPLLPLLPTFPAHADRTGKFSTKLTAKRRYLPRITSGLEELSVLTTLSEQDPLSAAAGVTEKISDDLPRAMDLFATTYFSEGNRISERERNLSNHASQVRLGLADVAKSAKRNDKQGIANAFQSVADAANKYKKESSLEELQEKLG